MDVVFDTLLTQPIGLLSLLTILFIVGIGFFLSALGHAQNEHPPKHNDSVIRSTP